MKYRWNWHVLVESPYLQWLASGFGWTLAVTLAAAVICVPLGVAIGCAANAQSRAARYVALCYIEVLRSVPVLVQMFLWFFVMPEVLPGPAGDWLKDGLPMPEYFSAVACLGVYTAARIAEQVRSGLVAQSPSLRAAAIALGLTGVQAVRLVQLPMAMRAILPAFASEMVVLLKNSSIALTIGLLELTAQARRIENYTFQAFEAFTVVTVVYLSCSLLTLKLMRLLERRLAVPGYIQSR